MLSFDVAICKTLGRQKREVWVKDGLKHHLGSQPCEMPMNYNWCRLSASWRVPRQIVDEISAPKYSTIPGIQWPELFFMEMGLLLCFICDKRLLRKGSGFRVCFQYFISHHLSFTANLHERLNKYWTAQCHKVIILSQAQLFLMVHSMSGIGRSLWRIIRSKHKSSPACPQKVIEPFQLEKTLKIINFNHYLN